MEIFSASGEQLAILGRVALAMLLGALIGIEREVADKPAGLRTHMLVAGAAALLVGLGQVTIDHFNLTTGTALRTDPIRIIEAVVTGVAFLGAGTIIRGQQGDVSGLTTAASLLFAAATGVAIALSQWILGAAVVLLVLLTLLIPRRFEQRLRKLDR